MKKTFSKLFISLVLASNLIYTTACTLNTSSPMSPENTITTGDETELKFTDVSSEKLSQFNSYISRGMSGSSTTGSTSSISPSASIAPSVAPSASAYPMPQATASSSGDSSNSSSGSNYIPTYPTASSSSSYNSSYPSSYYTSAPYYPIPTYSAYPMPTSYFYGNFEDYVVTSSQEAKLNGATGSYLDITKKVITPILLKLGKDVRLISGFGLTDGKGVTKKTEPSPSTFPTPSSTSYPIATPSPYYYQPYYNWQFTYVSSSKKEVYSILISSNETLVLKQVWGLKQISTSNIKIDSTDAIKIVKKAVEDKNYNKIPIPSAMPSYYPYYSDYYYNQSWEEVYSFEDYFEVSNSLEQYENNVFWNINFSIPYDRQTTTNVNGESYSYSSGTARVNANTGDITYLQRITKYKYTYDPCLYPTSAPYPCPTSTPTSYMPPDAITTSASPDVYISPSPTPYTSPEPSVVASSMP